jgi:hypothetical protein
MHWRDEKCKWGFRGKSCKEKVIGTPRYIWEDDTKIDIKKIGWTGFIWLRIVTTGTLV